MKILEVVSNSLNQNSNSQEIIIAWTHTGNIKYLLGSTGKNILEKVTIRNKE